MGGIAREALREQVKASDGNLCGGRLIVSYREEKIEIASDLVRLPGRGVAMKDEESESKQKIEEGFAYGGIESSGAARSDRRDSRWIKLARRSLSHCCCAISCWSRFPTNWYFTVAHWKTCAGWWLRRSLKSTKMDVALFKEITGVSRKYAIPLLEYLDREHVTRADGRRARNPLATDVPQRIMPILSPIRGRSAESVAKSLDLLLRETPLPVPSGSVKRLVRFARPVNKCRSTISGSEKYFFNDSEVIVGDVMRRASQFFDISKRSTFFLACSANSLPLSARTSPPAARPTRFDDATWCWTQ